MDFYHLPLQWRAHALRSNITSIDGPETWSTIGTGGGGDVMVLRSAWSRHCEGR